MPFCTLLGTIGAPGFHTLSAYILTQSLVLPVTAFLFAHAFQTVKPGESIFDSQIAKYGPPAAALILVTNFMCTGLIVGRIWYVLFCQYGLSPCSDVP